MTQRIRVWLAKNPGIVARIAEQEGVSTSIIYRVLKGRSTSARIVAALKAHGAPLNNNNHRNKQKRG